tara:strand:+ start:140 stop:1516 length:1377 start_codon:yes stop_codon:yes gene_type:complete
MAFTITNNKDLENHVDFDISFITSNLKDGEYFADDKKITPRTKNYIIKIPKTSINKLKIALRKEYGSTMTRDSISLETDTGVELILKKTGKTTVGSSDGQTTAMQERASLLIIQDGLMNNKRYTSVKDIMTKPIYQKIVEVYPDVNDFWLKGFLAQHKKMNTKFPNAKFDTFNRDGGFMDWYTKHIKNRYQINKKDTLNPADIWMLREEKQIKNRINSAKSLSEHNNIMRMLYKERKLCGISLKAVSGINARFEEINMKETIPETESYMLDDITMKMSITPEGRLDTTDTVIKISAETKSISFQIRPNSKGFNNLKFESTQKGAGAARLGKAPLQMVRTILASYGIMQNSLGFENKWQMYPANGQEFEDEADDYEMKFEDIHGHIKSNIKVDEFVPNMTRSFETNDVVNGYSTGKLMQLNFVYNLLELDEKDQGRLLTEMAYASQKIGKMFGPFGKLY